MKAPKPAKPAKPRKETKFTTREIVILTVLYYLIAAPVGSLISITYFNAYPGISPAQLPVNFSIIVLYLALPIYLKLIMPVIEGRTFFGSNDRKLGYIILGSPVLIFFAADQLVYPAGKHLLLSTFGTTVKAYTVDAYFVNAIAYNGSTKPKSYGYIDTYRVDDPAQDDVTALVVVYEDTWAGKTTKISFTPAKTVPLQIKQLNDASGQYVAVRYVRFAPYISELK